MAAPVVFIMLLEHGKDVHGAVIPSYSKFFSLIKKYVIMVYADATNEME